MWEFPAQLERVVDGDTVDMTVDLGFNMRRTVRLRLAGVDTAEIFGVSRDSEEYQTGIEHRQFVYDWFAQADHARDFPFRIETEKDTGKYGRYIATIIRADSDDCLNDALAEQFPVTA